MLFVGGVSYRLNLIWSPDNFDDVGVVTAKYPIRSNKNEFSLFEHYGTQRESSILWNGSLKRLALISA